jgi:hypothetical protein
MPFDFNSLDDAKTVLDKLESGEDLESTPAPAPAELPQDPEPTITRVESPSVDSFVPAPSIEEVPPKEEPTPVDAPAMFTPEALSDEQKATMQYAPNFGYEVKGEKKEFDDRLKSIIKTEEDEDFVRQLMTKSDGIDGLKTKLDEANANVKTFQDQFAASTEEVGTMKEFFTSIISDREAKDLRSVSKKLNIADDDILKYAMEIASERQLPVEQRMAIEGQRKMNEQMLAQTAQANQVQAVASNEALMLQNQKAQMQEQMLDFSIAQGHKQLSDMMAQHGVDLKQEVINNGRLLNAQRIANGLAEVSVPEALSETVKKFGIYNQAVKPVAPQVIAQPQARPAAIPTINGGVKTAVQKTPSTIEDLRTAFDTLNKNERSGH